MIIETFDSLPSTNQYCELLDLSQTEEFSVIYARQQTAGIGQRGNCWDSQPDKNLTFSLILKPSFLPAAEQYMLTKVVSLGITDCLQSLIPGGNIIKIKWPNDIYINDHKVCGILISNKLSRTHLSASIVGIGLNVNQTEFPSWVPNPISLKQITGEELFLRPLLENIVQAIQTRYRQLPTNPAILDQEYLSRLLRLHQPARYLYHGEAITATIQGVNQYGHLLLTTSEGRPLTCQLKELTFLP
ncbi:MAG: biotin--[acetyl-CoA-carboxylase] ligase [Bacteroidales bacterium]|nr:biotin--[acetyl-CoA-carboxylase] ligase [Bacteroidales bacterium]